jgi:hypothetical protein
MSVLVILVAVCAKRVPQEVRKLSCVFSSNWSSPLPLPSIIRAPRASAKSSSVLESPLRLATYWRKAWSNLPSRLQVCGLKLRRFLALNLAFDLSCSCCVCF